ncbi:MAG TPA: DUF454 domain-containing protein [Oceanospirillales bacterium]|nr:DUF454 domain-containing protein [Oceanospirillales bacterium]
MNKGIKQKLLIALGWFFVILGIIGALLPIMPTTVFLIIALAIFSKSSPRFHKMLLENKYFGKDLSRWEKNKTISPQSKKKASYVIIITFGVSIAILHGRSGLQIMLVVIALALLLVIWKIKEG